MPLQYASVFDESHARIAEYPKQADQPKYSEITEKIAATVDTSKSMRRSIQDKETPGLTYSVLCNGEGRVLICAATDMPSRTCFSMLEAVEPLVRCAAKDIRNGRKLIQMKMDFFNNPQNDKIANLAHELDAVIEVVTSDVEKVLARGETFDRILAKSTTLKEQAAEFQHTSEAVKHDMLCRNVRFLALVFAGVAAAALLIALIACRPDFSACK